MAKQVGELKLTGTLDNLVFYKKGNEYFVKSKPKPIGKKYHKDPKYARQRANNELFVKSVMANKLLRDSLGPVLSSIISVPVGQITKMFRQYYGIHQFEDEPGNEDLSFFKGFHLSEKRRIDSILSWPILSSLDRNSGHFRIIMPELNDCSIRAPKDATHFQVTIAVSAIDPGKKVSKMEMDTSPMVPVPGEPLASISLSVRIPELPGSMLFGVMAIQFFQKVAEEPWPLGRTQNAAVILQAGN